MNRFDWWYQSGMAAEAARGMVWFIIFVAVLIAFLWWRDQ